MKHGMTVRTYRYEMLDRIDSVSPCHTRQWSSVVHMYVARAKLSKVRCKVEATNSARRTEVRNTCFPSCWIPLIRIDGNAT